MSAAVPVADVVAREFRATLARRRMSAAALARAMSAPERTVQHALAGDREITLDQFVRMIAALDGEGEEEIVRTLVAAVRSHGIRRRA